MRALRVPASTTRASPSPIPSSPSSATRRKLVSKRSLQPTRIPLVGRVQPGSSVSSGSPGSSRRRRVAARSCRARSRICSGRWSSTRRTTKRRRTSSLRYQRGRGVQPTERGGGPTRPPVGRERRAPVPASPAPGTRRVTGSRRDSCSSRRSALSLRSASSSPSSPLILVSRRGRRVRGTLGLVELPLRGRDRSRVAARRRSAPRGGGRPARGRALRTLRPRTDAEVFIVLRHLPVDAGSQESGLAQPYARAKEAAREIRAALAEAPVGIGRRLTARFRTSSRVRCDRVRGDPRSLGRHRAATPALEHPDRRDDPRRTRDDP